MARGGETADDRPRFARLAQAIGLPLSGGLAIGGQCLLSLRGVSPWASLIPGAALYVVAAALTILTLILRRDEPEAERTGPPPPPGVEWTLVAAIVLGGLTLRVHRIDLIPWGLNNDEAIDAIETSEIVHGKPFSTFTERGLNRETMFHYLAAFAYRNPALALNLLRAMPAVFDLQPWLVGSESGLMDLIFPLRSVSIAAGALTILALYLFARSRFGWRVALLAAFFLAVSPWHLLYSRVGFRAILAPLFAVITVALFLRALDTGRLADHLAWGSTLGLGFWTYTSFRAMPLALAAFLLARRGRTAPPGAPSGTARSRPLLYGAGVAAAALLVIFAFSHLGLGGFVTRGAYASLPPLAGEGRGPLAGLATMARHLFHAATMTHYFPAGYAVVQSATFIGDGVSTVYGRIGLEPETTVVVALATLGFLEALFLARRRRDPPRALLVLSIVALLLMVGCTGPSLTRLLMNLPWICLLAALCVWRIADDLAALWRPLTGARAGAVLAVVLVVLPCAGFASVQGYTRYFLRAGRSAEAMQSFWPRQTIMGMFVRSLPPGPIVYMMHSYGRETLTYLIGNRPDVHLVTDPSTLDLDAIARMPRSAVFVVEYSEYSRPFAEALAHLMRRFPQGEMTQVADARFDPDKPIFYTFNLYKDEGGGPATPPPEAPVPWAPGN